jgi:hypothetical protein
LLNPCRDVACNVSTVGQKRGFIEADSVLVN